MAKTRRSGPGITGQLGRDTEGYAACINGSGGALAPGDVVQLKAAAISAKTFKPSVTKATSGSRVLGVVATNNHTTIPDGAEVIVQVAGYCTKVKVNGTTDIAVDDTLKPSTTADGVLVIDATATATANGTNPGFALAAFTTNGEGTIAAWLINPMGWAF